MQILHAARLTCPVLISGEPGSGKRLIAHAIHALGRRRARQIVTVDCSRFPRRCWGRRCSAPRARVPEARPRFPCGGTMLASAKDGTLLLNEIPDMPSSIQGRLQKLLEADGQGVPDVRFVSTSSKRMEQLVETKHFRADLCYRLNVLPIEVPPLRKRLQDVAACWRGIFFRTSSSTAAAGR